MQGIFAINLRIIFLGFFLYLSTTPVKGNPDLSSLQEELSQTSSKDDRFELLIKLSDLCARTDYEQGLEYAEEAFAIAKSIGNVEWEAKSLVCLAKNNVFGGDKHRALEITNEGLRLKEEHVNKAITAELYHIKGLSYFFMGKDKEAVLNYHKALEINESIGEFENVLRQLNNLSLIYRDVKHYDMALEYLHRCRELISEHKTLNHYSVHIDFNTGYILLHQKKYREALPFIERGTKANEQLKDSIHISVSYNTLAIIKNELGQYEEAIALAQKSLFTARAVDYQEGEIYALHTIGEINNRLKNYPAAIKNTLAALKLAERLNTKRYTEGILETLISVNRSIGKMEAALDFQDQLIEYKDSMYNIEKDKLIDQLDIEYITREKEEENRLLRAENQESLQVISLQQKLNMVSIGFGLLFLVLSFTLYRALKTRKRYNKELESAIDVRTKELQNKNRALEVSNQELERFAHIASHDLKEPLRNITSFANLIVRRLGNQKDKELLEYAGFIIRGTKQMNHLVQSILSFAKVNQGGDQSFEYVDVNLVVEQILSHLSLQIKENKVQVKLAELPRKVWCNPDLIFLLIKNLIENGIKYNNKSTPVVSIYSKENESVHTFIIEDNGIGIDPKYFDKIFVMFARLHNRQQFQGSGMGLSICRKIVEQWGGKIWVESATDKGSTFYFTIPKNDTNEDENLERFVLLKEESA